MRRGQQTVAYGWFKERNVVLMGTRSGAACTTSQADVKLMSSVRPTLGVNQELRIPVSNVFRKVNLCLNKLAAGVLQASMEHGDRVGALQSQPNVLGALGEVLSTPLEVAFAEFAHVSVAVLSSNTAAERTHRRCCRCSG
jgi:hypothetical protein